MDSPALQVFIAHNFVILLSDIHAMMSLLTHNL